MTPFDEAAREAGRALGDCGADEGSSFVGEVAQALGELAEEPPASRGARPKPEVRDERAP